MTHMKKLFVQFLEQVPAIYKKAEDLLPVLFSMMMLSREEMNRLQKARQDQGKEQVNQQVKKSIMGGFFGKKQ